jgi:hypothetical protein
MRNSLSGPREKLLTKPSGRPLATLAMPLAKLGSEKANRVINRVEGLEPSRLAVTEFRNQFDEKPTEDAEPATSVPDERETGLSHS